LCKGEVGIAAIQISNPVLFLCQFSDSPTYPRNHGNKIKIINMCRRSTHDVGIRLLDLLKGVPINMGIQ